MSVHRSDKSVWLNPGFTRSYSGGFALLILLVTMALGLIIYAIQLQGLGDKTNVLSQGEPTPQSFPWDELWRLEQRHRTAVADQNLGIPEAFDLTASVKEDGRSRGEALLTVYPEGSVVGAWGGSYYRTVPHPDKPGKEIRVEVEISANLEGIIDPGKEYRDEGGQTAPDTLFMILQGEYRGTETDRDTNQVRMVAGQLVLSGWLPLDNRGFGTLHLLGADQQEIVFDWTSRPDR